MKKWEKYRLSMVISMTMITILSGYILVIGLSKVPTWLAIIGSLVFITFLLIMWLKTTGLDSVIRKKMFFKTGNLDDLTKTDYLDDEIKEYVNDPNKMKELKEKIESEKIQKKRNEKINNLLK